MDLNLEMVYVEGGTFEMGSTPGQQEGWGLRKVKIDSYYIGKYEVTTEQWYACMGTKPWNELDDGRVHCELGGYGTPACGMSWEEASEFCAVLSRKTGKKYVLPTEAQWEYAARGGKKSKGYIYSGSNAIEQVGWYNSDRPHVVGTKKPNELGIYDMSGNVYEFCLDWYADEYDENDTDNPQGPVSGKTRVARGGGWWDKIPSGCEVACRYEHLRPTSCSPVEGLRIAMVL